MVAFKPIAKNAAELWTLPMEHTLAKEKAELFAAEDWADYGRGKNAPRKRREFFDA